MGSTPNRSGQALKQVLSLRIGNLSKRSISADLILASNVLQDAVPSAFVDAVQKFCVSHGASCGVVAFVL